MGWPIIVVPFLNANGMALFPFILVKEKSMKRDVALINHEKIHLLQQAELLVLPFYILYLLNYMINLIKYKRHYQAYLNIAFEREAYANETNMGYLNKRKYYNWLRYFN
ncbi:hypothetical protein FPZ43_08460 [Mucilaginibacter pallidiroseus]|uniref:DUF4157 domain-containing protein n=1 Tax=Mucilaginibacter pallidiroseus TaxID=2599295 RepID=A0A563UF21_9SPHI|nr:hypothetical protein [Mucilaginibacter pallidiroseus]TWR29873.1 hypothetical protein FPZ43_08460 [Mucilaginibacter pallidiroseus]